MVSESVEETKAIAEKFLKQLLIEEQKDRAYVVALSGDLGSGKTTFTQAIASLLGIKEQVLSPTFVLEKIYKIEHLHFTHFIHIDAYRLEDEGEIVAIGFNDMVTNNKNLIFIEWPEKIEKAIPKPYVKITFDHKDENSREISFDYEKN